MMYQDSIEQQEEPLDLRVRVRGISEISKLLLKIRDACFMEAFRLGVGNDDILDFFDMFCRKSIRALLKINGNFTNGRLRVLDYYYAFSDVRAMIESDWFSNKRDLRSEELQAPIEKLHIAWDSCHDSVKPAGTPTSVKRKRCTSAIKDAINAYHERRMEFGKALARVKECVNSDLPYDCEIQGKLCMLKKRQLDVTLTLREILRRVQEVRPRDDALLVITPCVLFANCTVNSILQGVEPTGDNIIELYNNAMEEILDKNNMFGGKFQGGEKAVVCEALKLLRVEPKETELIKKMYGKMPINDFTGFYSLKYIGKLITYKPASVTFTENLRVIKMPL